MQIVNSLFSSIYNYSISLSTSSVRILFSASNLLNSRSSSVLVLSGERFSRLPEGMQTLIIEKNASLPFLVKIPIVVERRLISLIAGEFKDLPCLEFMLNHFQHDPLGDLLETVWEIDHGSPICQKKALEVYLTHLSALKPSSYKFRENTPQPIRTFIHLFDSENWLPLSLERKNSIIDLLLNKHPLQGFLHIVCLRFLLNRLGLSDLYSSKVELLRVPLESIVPEKLTSLSLIFIEKGKTIWKDLLLNHNNKSFVQCLKHYFCESGEGKGDALANELQTFISSAPLPDLADTELAMIVNFFIHHYSLAGEQHNSFQKDLLKFLTALLNGLSARGEWHEKVLNILLKGHPGSIIVQKLGLYLHLLTGLEEKTKKEVHAIQKECFKAIDPAEFEKLHIVETGIHLVVDAKMFTLEQFEDLEPEIFLPLSRAILLRALQDQNLKRVVSLFHEGKELETKMGKVEASFSKLGNFDLTAHLTRDEVKEREFAQIMDDAAFPLIGKFAKYISLALNKRKFDE